MVRKRNAYALLGLVVWRGARWYLRWRLASARRIGARAGAGLTVAALAALAARRLAR